MTRGISIHIGLNYVDRTQYDGWDGQLQGCLNDAHAMQSLAAACGFETTIILNEQAVAVRVLQEISGAARQLASNDILLLTYSGHGGQVDDTSGDEEDKLDETWVLYDRMLLDDELHQLWSKFPAGVRIVVISDSCHSGTIVRNRGHERALADLRAIQELYGGDTLAPAGDARPILRLIPQHIAAAAYEQHADLYRTVKAIAGPERRTTIDASVLLISGCQDNQYSLDGLRNGLFTEKLLEVWSNGQFQGGYDAFRTEIGGRLPPTQTPNLTMIPRDNLTLRAERPFCIDANASIPANTTSASSINAPAHAAASDPAPIFVVHPGTRRYYVVEVATQPELFDYATHGAERTETNFYGSWSQTPFGSAVVYPANYRLPQQIWSQLGRAERLYYRLWATDSADSWVNYVSTTPDAAANRAPSIRIVTQATTTPVNNDTLNRQMIRYPSGAEFAAVSESEIDDRIDYSDPSPAHGNVPLIRVADRLDERLSDNFHVREFVHTQSQAGGMRYFRFARIAPELVEALQQLRERVGRPITINSSYRYLAVNDSVGGAEDSRHLAGQAADIACQGLTAVELARDALELFGATIGIGLGKSYIHIDVRGQLATWTYSGAAMNAAEFADWAHEIIRAPSGLREYEQKSTEQLADAGIARLA